MASRTLTDQQHQSNGPGLL